MPGWAAKLAGATCRLAALLHLAGHLRDGWNRPINANTFASAIQLADYLTDHARAVFDLMGADPRLDDARWLLDWIARTGQAQFTRRDAHHAAPRGRFPKATDLDPALALLEEHGWLRRVDADSPGPKGGRPPSPRFLVNPLHPTTEPTQPTKPHPPAGSVGSEVLWRVATPWRAPGERQINRHVIQRERPQPLPAVFGVVPSRQRRPAACQCAATTRSIECRPPVGFGEALMGSVSWRKRGNRYLPGTGRRVNGD